MVHRFSGVSGVDSREWRKSVAAVAKSRKSYVRTVKFPLELKFDDELDFEAVTQLFEVTEGTGTHTLFGVLTGAHLAGFRFFPNARQNETFRSLGQVENQFSIKWKDQTDIASKLSPSMLIEFAKTPRRAAGGKAKKFNKETILSDFATKSGLTAANRNQECSALSFLENYLGAISETFRSWVDLNERAHIALELFDSEAAKHGLNLPKIGKSFTKLKELTPPGSSIGFDDKLMVPETLNIADISLHQVVAQKFRMLRADGVASPKPADLQAVITTASNNALSWLFGAGFSYWRNTAPKTIYRDFDVPKVAQPRVKKLKSIFDGISTDALFGAKHYSIFRSSVGGKLDSWIANYVAQLIKIDEALSSFETWRPNEQLASEPARRYFRSLGITYAELVESIEGVEKKRAEARNSVNALLGLNDTLPSETDVNQIEEFSRQVAAISGSLESIKNAINQDLESDHVESVALANECRFSAPTWLKGLPRVNQISGGIPAVDEELRDLEQSFKQVRALKGKLTSGVLSQANGASQLSEELTRDIEREAKLLSKRDMPDATPVSQAKRRVLGRLCGIGKTGSDFFKKILQTAVADIFADQKDLRRLINSGQGALYVSPFSTGRHQPLTLKEDALSDHSPVETIDKLISLLTERVGKSKDFQEYRDLLRVENLADTLALSRLPEEIPKSWLALKEIKETANIPDAISPLLNAKTISRQTVIKLSNLLTSQLNGSLAKGFRKTFFVRTKFQRVGFNELNWVPKPDRPWSPPQQVEKSTGDLGQSIRLVREKIENADAPLDPRQTANAITTDLKADLARGSGIAPLFQQLPHDWYLDLGIVDMRSEISGFGVNKEHIRRAEAKMQSPARLIGASASKNFIDQWLTDPEIKIGEHNILFEQHYEQEVELDDDLNPTFKVSPTILKAELALTITDERESRDTRHLLADSVIGIDLGEAGIGYSVFKTEEIHRAVGEGREPMPFETGSIPVRSVRDLIKRVKRHRSTIQPNQRFRQGASTALEQLRAGALGDVTFVIDALCAKHKGFPVLETSVANLASGGKQLQLIYDKIVHTYSFSDVDAHKSARRHHWAGAENWDHPTLYETERKQGPDGLWQPTGARRQLKLFPGSAVHPAGTSQTCSACHRNPFKAIEDSVADNGETTFQIANSSVELASGDTILLRSSTDSTKSQSQTEKERAGYARRKERAPNQYPIEQRSVNQQELRRMVAKQLRHGQKSLRSKDTTQSAYSCVFADCGNNMHADENAAINIVRKWVRDRGIH